MKTINSKSTTIQQVLLQTLTSFILREQKTQKHNALQDFKEFIDYDISLIGLVLTILSRTELNEETQKDFQKIRKILEEAQEQFPQEYQRIMEIQKNFSEPAQEIVMSFSLQESSKTIIEEIRRILKILIYAQSVKLVLHIQSNDPIETSIIVIIQKQIEFFLCTLC